MNDKEAEKLISKLKKNDKRKLRDWFIFAVVSLLFVISNVLRVYTAIRFYPVTLREIYIHGPYSGGFMTSSYPGYLVYASRGLYMLILYFLLGGVVAGLLVQYHRYQDAALYFYRLQMSKEKALGESGELLPGTENGVCNTTQESKLNAVDGTEGEKTRD